MLYLYSMESRKMNWFSVLADSDSESSSFEEETLPSQNLENSITIQPPQQFRTWVKDEIEQRFTGDEIKGNIFSSPFSKNKHSHKQWTKPRFREDGDGWVSLRWSQPQFEENTDPPYDTTEPIPEVVVEEKQFPSLLTRGETIKSATKEDSLSAFAWAEKIKKNLEKAELVRAAKAKEFSETTTDSFCRLSFFRRPMLVEIPEGQV